MYTANTMASAIEAMGMSLPNSSAQAAVSPAKREDCRARRRGAVLNLHEARHPPRDIMTKEAFENAIALVMALGGSTNAVLHLLAIAHTAKVKLTLDDFTRIGKPDAGAGGPQAQRQVRDGGLVRSAARCR
jgi:dihydroxy-acid dehydratase